MTDIFNTLISFCNNHKILVIILVVIILLLVVLIINRWRYGVWFVNEKVHKAHEEKERMAKKEELKKRKRSKSKDNKKIKKEEKEEKRDNKKNKNKEKDVSDDEKEINNMPQKDNFGHLLKNDIKEKSEIKATPKKIIDDNKGYNPPPKVLNKVIDSLDKDSIPSKKIIV